MNVRLLMVTTDDCKRRTTYILVVVRLTNAVAATVKATYGSGAETE